MEQTIIIPRALKQKITNALTYGRVVLFSAPCGFGKTTVANKLCMRSKPCTLSAESLDFCIPAADRTWNTLLVDDLQAITRESDQQDLCALIRECPDRQFWLLGRGLIPSWLMPFQISGVLTVITAQDLKLDRESTGQLLQDYGVSVPDAVLTAIYEETLGYALAVTLLARRMAHGQEYNRTTSDEIRRDLFLYYEDAVFNRWDPVFQRLMLDLSPFEAIDNELARIVSGSNSAGRLLGKLVRESNMLIQDELDTYHFWPIFRQFLMWELEQQRSRDYCLGLYNRGGLYYELKEDYAQALKYYALGENRYKITELLVRNAEMHPGMGHYLEMEPYYRSLPEHEILDSPALMQGMSMLCAMRMDYDGSQRWYDELKAYIQDKRGGAAQIREARGRLAWLDIALPQRKVEVTAEFIPGVFHLLTSRELRLPPFSVTSSLPSLMNGGKDFSPWSKQDDLLYSTLRKPVEAVLGRDGVCLGDCALAESKFEKGEDIRDRAMGLLQNLDRIRRDGTPDIEFAVVGLLVRMQMQLGRAQDARNNLERLRERFVQAKQMRFLPNLDAMMCRVDLLLGDDTAVALWYRDQAPKNPQDVQQLKRYQYFTQAMVQLSFGREREALVTLAPLEGYCQACRRYIDTIHLHVLRAIALKRLGRENWREELSAGLDIAWEYSFVRPISQYATAVLSLLKESDWDRDVDFLDTVISATRRQAAFYPDYLTPRLEMAAPLSAAEQQVLHLLCAGKSNAEIGEILGIKLATVKTHISHIFDKLHVRRRSEVKDAACRLHLISRE